MDGHGPVNDPPVLTALKDHIALQYGRCLLNMNKFEMILKVVLPTLRISGIPAELAGQIERERQVLGNQTLGYLITQFCERTTAEDKPEVDEESFTGPHISISYGFDEEFGGWLNERLTQLLKLRNELVHGFHGRFDTHSEASCQEAIIYLAEALHFIRESLRTLHSLLESFKSSQQAMAEIVEPVNDSV